MTTSWQSFAGDTSRFAVQMALQADPHHGQGATNEEGASWGSLAIWVRGTNICAYTVDDVSADGVHWYLLPVVEWFVENWDALFHEEKPPNRDAGFDAASSLHATRFAPSGLDEADAQRWEHDWSGWWERHCLLAAREGGLLPDLTIRRFRDKVELSWRDSPIAGAHPNLRFASTSGTARLAPLDVAEPLNEVLSEFATELSTRLSNSKRARGLVRDAEKLSSPERHERRMAWLIGLGTTSRTTLRRWRTMGSAEKSAVEPRLADDVFGSHSSGLVISETPVLGLLFGSASPHLPARDVDTILSFVLKSTSSSDGSSRLSSLVHKRDVPYDLADAVSDGSDLAEDTLATLDLPFDSQVDIDGVLSSLEVRVASLPLTDRATRAVTIASPTLAPTIAVNTGYPWNQAEPVRRFTLAHELCHILADQSRARRVAVMSGPWAPRSIERRANAFAASFLMPVDTVKWAITQTSGRVDSVESVLDVARHLGTSASATLERLGNLGILDAATIEGLRESLHWSRIDGRAQR